MTDVMTAVDVVPVPDYGTRPRRRPWSAGRVLGWGFGSVVGLGLVGAVLLPNLCGGGRSRETASRAKCASNLHQIGLAIILYQQENGGAYPDTLGRLALTQNVGPEVFVCPSGPDVPSTADTPAKQAAEIDAGPAGHHCSYVYFGRGLHGEVPATTVVACDAPDDHERDGVTVLYGDGHADWEPPAAVAGLLPAALVPDDPRWRPAVAAAGRLVSPQSSDGSAEPGRVGLGRAKLASSGG